MYELRDRFGVYAETLKHKAFADLAKSEKKSPEAR